LLKDRADLEDLKQKYLNQFSNEKIKKSKETEFNATVASMTNNKLTVGVDNNNPIVVFLNQQQAVRQELHTEKELVLPEIARTNEEIVEAMLEGGPFIDPRAFRNGACLA